MNKAQRVDVQQRVFYALQELRKRSSTFYKPNPRPLKNMGRWLEDQSRIRRVKGRTVVGMKMLRDSGFVSATELTSSTEEVILAVAHDLSYSFIHESVGPTHDKKQYDMACLFFERWARWMTEQEW